jgi:hypothetical protein
MLQALRFQKVGFFFTQNRFIPLLKKMSIAAAMIIGDEVFGLKPSHYRGNGNVAGFKKQMEMIGIKHSCKTAGICLSKDCSRSIQKILYSMLPLEIAERWIRGKWYGMRPYAHQFLAFAVRFLRKVKRHGVEIMRF